MRTQFRPRAQRHVLVLLAIVVSSQSCAIVDKLLYRYSAAKTATALIIANSPKSSSDLQLSLNLSGVIRLRCELMCLISGKNNDGGIHPLIFCPSFMRKRLAFSFCCAFLFSFCARGCLPRAPAIAQDTTKQTGAFSLPLLLYTADEAWQSSLRTGPCQKSPN